MRSRRPVLPMALLWAVVPVVPATALAAPPADPCAEPIPITDDVEEVLRPPRQALGRWLSWAERCPSAGSWFHVAAAEVLIAQQDRAVVHLQTAVDRYRRALAANPSPQERPLVEERLRRTEGMLSAWRARPLLQEARAAAARQDDARALDHYDEFLKASVGDPERPVVEVERSRFLERYRADWDKEATRRHVGGGLLVGFGLVAAGGGAALVLLSQSTADEAKTAPNVAAHDVKVRDATFELVGGAALAGAGTVALIAGIVRLASGGKEPPQALWVAPMARGLALGGTF